MAAPTLCGTPQEHRSASNGRLDAVIGRSLLMRRTALLAVLALSGAGASASAAQAADGCPNAALRAQQGADMLSNCRAWEQVTPVDKGHGGLTIGRPNPFRTPAVSGLLAYQISTGIPGTSSAVLATSAYRARRTDGGWSSEPYDLPVSNKVSLLDHGTLGISNDLSSSLTVSTQALTPDATPGLAGLYRHNLNTGLLELVVEPRSPAENDGFLNYLTDPTTFTGVPAVFRGSSADFSHVLLVGGFQGDTPAGMTVWEWHNGQMRLVNRLPDGTPGVDANTGASGVGWSFQGGNYMSGDGNTVFFNQGGHVYVRIGGAVTKLISRSVRSGDDPSQPVQGDFMAASSNGRYAFIQSSEQLTDEDVTSGAYPKLYRADTVTNELRLITPSGALGTAVWAASDDGHRLYFTQAGENYGVDNDLYLWDDGTLRRIAAVSDNTAVRMAPDGRYAIFNASTDVLGRGLGEDCRNQEGSPRRCDEMYGFDAQTGTVRCLSCAAGGRSGGDATVGTANIFSYVPRTVLLDGTYLFDTPTALVPEDVNRKRDVYLWKDGVVRLMTSGLDRNDATYVGMSADGIDVYFHTYGRLVSADVDNNLDVYTARVDGGLASQNVVSAPPSVCQADACQGPAGSAGRAPLSGSATFAGPGNATQAHARPSKVQVSKVKAVKGSVATMRVWVSSAGSIAASGGGLRTIKRAASKAGSYVLKVTLSRQAKATLKRKGTARVRVMVTFKPTTGAVATATVAVRFTQMPGGR